MPIHYADLLPKLTPIAEAAQHQQAATPYFREKYERLIRPKVGQRIVEVFLNDLRVAGIDPRDRVVLDAGCGSGIYSTLFHLLGAERVEALDLFEQNVNSLRELAATRRMPVEVHRCDVAESGLPDRSIDIVFCTEAISHIADWRRFLREAHRTIRPGGQLLITDWNNGASPWLRWKIRRLWKQMELGPFTVEEYPPDRENLPYPFRRWMIIRKTFPEISDQQVFHLGLHTAGLWGEGLIETCRLSLLDGKLPESAYSFGQSVRRPEDGQTTEEPVDPREVVRILRDLGMQARARAHFGFNRSPLLPLLNEAAAWVPGITLSLSERYLVTALKPAT